MESSKPHIEELSDDAIGAAVAVGNKTKTEDITFNSAPHIELVNPNPDLQRFCEPLLKAFVAMKKTPASEAKVTMIHVRNGVSAMLPVEEGWEIDLIPVREMGGQPSVNGKEFGLGQYAHLTEKCEVTGDMYAVLLLWKPES